MSGPSIQRVGILTGGGDCPGLNAVIRAVVKAGMIQHAERLFTRFDAETSTYVSGEDWVIDTAGTNLRDALAVAVAQHGFQNEAQGNRQPGNAAEAGLLQSGQRVKLSLSAIAEVKLLQAAEQVVWLFHRHVSYKR